jgi:hypothetical protein
MPVLEADSLFSFLLRLDVNTNEAHPTSQNNRIGRSQVNRYNSALENTEFREVHHVPSHGPLVLDIQRKSQQGG